jgi:hypothetical protein
LNIEKISLLEEEKIKKPIDIVVSLYYH